MVRHRPASIFFDPIKSLPAPAILRRKRNIGRRPGRALPDIGLLVGGILSIAIDSSLKLVGMRVKLCVGGIAGAEVEGSIITIIEIGRCLVGVIPQIAINNTQIDIQFTVALRPPRHECAGVPVAHPTFPCSPSGKQGSWWG